jgi:phosphatidylglycerol:prolipoprotein diacylglycerol transferase
MVFPQSGSLILRHPSQIYQFLGEGILLFIVLWFYARKPRATGTISGVFMIGYGSLRFIAEYFREPDAQLGLLAFGMTMGQWLCVPMLFFGFVLWFISSKRSS